MDLADVVWRGIYRYRGLDVIVVARLPGGPSEDDPDGPQSGDAVMVKYLGDDHKFIIDPADLETDECPKCGFDLKSDGYPIGHKTDEGDDCSFRQNDLVPFKISKQEILARRVDEL